LVSVDPYALPPGSFLAALGVRFEPVTPAGMDTVVTGTVEVDERHHTPWGVVHGGVYCAAIESAATVGACAVVEADGRFAVGVDNVTDFLRPMRSGRLVVEARPAQIGRTLQLWRVTIMNAEGKLVASGRVRLANQDRTG
jgi:1,4-dihydroxy-2-naphthoyl-CoA hydrolase